MRFYLTCRCGKIHVVIRGYKGESSSEVSDRVLVLFLRHQPFPVASWRQPLVMGYLNQLVAAGETWLSATARDWSQQTKRKPAGDNLLFFWDFVGLTWTKPYLITSQTRVKRVSPIHISSWRPPIAFLYLFLFHSLLRLASFLSQYKND